MKIFVRPFPAAPRSLIIMMICILYFHINVRYWCCRFKSAEKPKKKLRMHKKKGNQDGSEDIRVRGMARKDKYLTKTWKKKEKNLSITTDRIQKWLSTTTLHYAGRKSDRWASSGYRWTLLRSLLSNNYQPTTSNPINASSLSNKIYHIVNRKTTIFLSTE